MGNLKTTLETVYDKFDREKNTIPRMLAPLGKHWEQPEKKNILIDNTHAIMCNKDFKLLPEYSTSIPTGVYEGKMWKKKVPWDREPSKWYLVWFGFCDKPEYCSNNYREILLS